MAIVKISDLPLVDAPVEGTDLFVVVQDNVTKKAYASDIQTYVGFEEVQYATAGQTVFNLTTMTYAAGANNLMVFVDGVNQYEGLAYQETDNNTVTFTQGLHEGAVVKFSTVQTQTSLVNNAGAVSYVAAGAGAVPTNVQTKLRETVSVKDFGAVGDGVTDDTAAIQNAINESAGKVLSFVRGETYRVTSELDFHTGSEGPKIQGNMATIIADAAMQSVVYVGNTTTINTQIYDLIIDANGLATYGFYGILITEQNSLLQNVTVKNAVSHGMYLDGCQSMALINVRAVVNGGDGFLFESCNATSCTSLRAVDNTGNGFTIQRGVRNYSGGMQLQDVDSEFNGGHAISVVDTAAPVTIIGGWIESNTQDGVNIGGSARGVSVNDLGIIGVEGAGNYRAIRLQDGANGCIITGNKFNYATGGSAAYTVVKDENTNYLATNLLNPNYIRTSGEQVYPVTFSAYTEGNVIGNKLVTTNTGGAGGYLSGVAYVGNIAANGGTSTFTWTPTGDFNIPGASNRGAYFIELDIVGYFAGIDQTVFIRAHIYAATLGASIYDESSTVVYSYGDSRKANITFGTPTCPGSSAIQVVITNTDLAQIFHGTFTYRTIMTTTGQLTLAVA